MLDFVDAGEWIQFLGGFFSEIPVFVACSLVPISIAVSVWRYFRGECSAWEKYTPALAVVCLWLVLAELHYMLTPPKPDSDRHAVSEVRSDPFKALLRSPQYHRINALVPPA